MYVTHTCINVRYLHICKVLYTKPISYIYVLRYLSLGAYVIIIHFPGRLKLRKSGEINFFLYKKKIFALILNAKAGGREKRKKFYRHPLTLPLLTPHPPPLPSLPFPLLVLGERGEERAKKKNELL